MLKFFGLGKEKKKEKTRTLVASASSPETKLAISDEGGSKGFKRTKSTSSLAKISQNKNENKGFRKGIFFKSQNLSSSAQESNSPSEAIDNFINKLKQCRGSANQPGYFAALEQNEYTLLQTVAHDGFFDEIIHFLEQFHQYRQKQISGMTLYSLLEPLNLNDDEDKKSLDALYSADMKDNKGLLDGEEARIHFGKIEESMFDMLSYNLRIKRDSILKAMHQHNVSMCSL
ncbi:hypothetical protein [Legionella jordanis]|uniref:Uncharacterized protein n=1 Tax=Legionella jordanis TaxID=456 RepID=A0A0W0VD77_9GAMM|nr:hypothetical protein [Legionella jordanis]KTD18085.1 hypothetical protein Ljor_2391 [Legionella jordanis]RMX00599.1 hypothetical protein EAW55_12640 [Legionella jordanis]RMX21285.1 hypothetical protein EAS68_03685 [Legionella jordanis]VEH13823.1 Uncharacterised protein [Legionella jordanis]HAT8714204.1 hypothetical protein [Legionella jordanis]